MQRNRRAVLDGASIDSFSLFCACCNEISKCALSTCNHNIVWLSYLCLHVLINITVMVAQLLCEIGLVVLMLGSLVSGIQQFGELVPPLWMAILSEQMLCTIWMCSAAQLWYSSYRAGETVASGVSFMAPRYSGILTEGNGRLVMVAVVLCFCASFEHYLIDVSSSWGPDTYVNHINWFW